jgi:hypothetical protein
LAGTRLARLQERLAVVRRARAGEEGPMVVYADDDEQAVQEYVARRERMGAELVVVMQSLAPRPASQPAPWSEGASAPPPRSSAARVPSN